MLTAKMNVEVQPLKVLVTRQVVMNTMDYSAYKIDKRNKIDYSAYKIYKMNKMDYFAYKIEKMDYSSYKIDNRKHCQRHNGPEG